jgi:TPR repeat protein
LSKLAAAALVGLACLGTAAAAGDEAEQLARLRSAAEKGDAVRQYELAQRYQLGIGAPKDEAESLKWLRRAAEAGSQWAQFDLGDRYAHADGVGEDAELARKWYRRAAEQGHFRAQRKVGEAYLLGEGVPRDCAQAAAWLRRAAAEDDTTAQYHLGVLHATGCGAAQDDAEAARWYRLAAEGGDEGAQVNLGLMHHAGRGVERNPAEAVKWFRRAYLRREPALLASNGAAFATGARRAEGIPRDDVLAFFWLSVAVAEGAAAQEPLLETVQGRLAPGQLEEALRLLKHWQMSAEPTLEEWVFLLGASNPGVSRVAERAVTEAGREAVPALVAALQSARSGHYIAGLSEAARRLGPAAQEAGPALEKALSSPSLVGRFRPGVAQALIRVDPARAAAAVPVLEQCSRDPVQGAFGRLECLLGLDIVGSESTSTRLALLEDEDDDLRLFAAKGLRVAPAAAIRGPLTARLRDKVLGVRVAAAGSLLVAVPDPPAAALPTLLEGVCQGNGFDARQVARALEEAPPVRAAEAVGPLVASLRGADARCRAWTAVALSRVDPRRAIPLLGALRSALASEDELLRSAAAETLVAIGAPARAALPDLEAAVRTDPELGAAVAAVRRGPVSLDKFRLQDLRLVAAGQRAGEAVAYLLDEGGLVWEVKAGQRLLDGAIERIDVEGGSLSFRGEAFGDDQVPRPFQAGLKLFEHGDPPARPFDRQAYTGDPLSIDFEADVASLAMLATQFSGLNTIVEAGTRGRVRVAARSAPWDGVLARGLEDGGFGYRVDRTYVRIGRRERMATLRPLSPAPPKGQPVTLSFRDVAMRDLARIFAEISGLQVELHPPEPHDPVTVFAHDVPWDEAFDLVVASRGWTHRVEGGAIHVEAPK